MGLAVAPSYQRFLTTQKWHTSYFLCVCLLSTSAALVSATTLCDGRVSRANRITSCSLVTRIDRGGSASPRIWNRFFLAVSGHSCNQCSSVWDAKLHLRQAGSAVESMTLWTCDKRPLPVYDSGHFWAVPTVLDRALLKERCQHSAWSVAWL